MPELPEVETIARELRKKVVGKRITNVWVDREKTVRQAGGIESFRRQVKNKKILDVRRRAKYIIMDIEGKKTIFIHQKISGHMLYGRWAPQIQNSKFPEPSPTASYGAGKIQNENLKFKIENLPSNVTWASTLPGPLKDDSRNFYIRLIFFLSNSYQMGLSDLRRFAKVILVDDDKVSELKEIKELGPEPLEIGFNKFKSLFGKKKGRIKQVLMDPKFIAGIGNIYSNEILWDAGYHPLSRVEKLKEPDIKKIFNSIIKILKTALKYKGDSIDDYRLPSGKKGGYQNVQKAYQQTGKKCAKRDGGVIQRLKIGGRSAHFCSKHQILK